MKTLLIWSAILYGIPALLSLAILFFQKDRGTLRHYFKYCGWCLVPAVNWGIIYFWVLQLRNSFRQWARDKFDDRERIAISFAVRVWLTFVAAFLFLALIFYIGTYDYAK